MGWEPPLSWRKWAFRGVRRRRPASSTPALGDDGFGLWRRRQPAKAQACFISLDVAARLRGRLPLQAAGEG